MKRVAYIDMIDSVEKLLEEQYGFEITDKAQNGFSALLTRDKRVYKVAFLPYTMPTIYPARFSVYDESGRAIEADRRMTLGTLVGELEGRNPSPWDGTPEMLHAIWVAEQGDGEVLVVGGNDRERWSQHNVVDVLDVEGAYIRLGTGFSGHWYNLKEVKYIWPLLPDSHEPQ